MTLMQQKITFCMPNLTCSSRVVYHVRLRKLSASVSLGANSRGPVCYPDSDIPGENKISAQMEKEKGGMCIRSERLIIKQMVRI